MTKFAPRDRAVVRQLGAATGCLPFRFSLCEAKEPILFFSSEHARWRPIPQGKRLVIFADGVPEVSESEHLRKRVQLVINTGTAGLTAAFAGSASPKLIVAKVTFMETFQPLAGSEKTGYRTKVRSVVFDAPRLDV